MPWVKEIAKRYRWESSRLIFVAVVLAMGTVGCQGPEEPMPETETPSEPQAASARAVASQPDRVDTKTQSPDGSSGKGLPRLVDLRAKQCIPCKMMAPILEELKKEYEGQLEVQFIDVRENPQAAYDYGIQLIPTQIFYNASGKELFRHEGYFSKEDILRKWEELGVRLEKEEGDSLGE